MGTLSVEPLIPVALWMALALAGALLLGWHAVRRPAIVSPLRWGFIVFFMSVALLVVLGILLNPTWVREIEPPPGKPLLTILLEASPCRRRGIRQAR